MIQPGAAGESPRWQVDDGKSKRLAELLVEVARVVDPRVAASVPSSLGGDPRLEALRTVLLEQDRASMALLQDKFDDPKQLAEAVGSVLANAFSVAASRDEALARAMAPTLERATQASIRKDPSTLVGILYPLMGPAIRKSIAESLDTTLQGLNQAFTHSFSLRGLKWRLEALRSGSSFGDIVLKHTVQFRVEHVFLIHRKTGLLLEHMAAKEVASQDPQMVSGMLTAIRDFVSDSFEGGSKGGAIDALRLGDLLLWCEESPFAFLAAVIRGNPPESLRADLREALTRIHEDLRIPLEEFDGDSSALGDLVTSLEGCLKQQEQPPPERISPWLWATPVVLAVLFGTWMGFRILETSRVEAFVERLRDEPGIVVTSAEREGGQWQVAGLRDPLAVDPASVLALANLDSTRVVGHWETYQALDPEISLRRLTSSLSPPPSVSFFLDGGMIRAAGNAPDHWVAQARTLIAAQPAGSPPVDLTAVTDIQDPNFVRLRDAIQSHSIQFNSNAPRPAPGQEVVLDALAQELRELTQVAADLGFSVGVMIVGHADPTGNETANLSLSAARAEVVRSLLRDRGIAPERLTVRSAGQLEPLQGGGPQNAGLNRRVTFAVSTSD